MVQAVLFLLSVQEQVDLIVQYRREEYDEVVNQSKGDNFYIRTHFNYTASGNITQRD